MPRREPIPESVLDIKERREALVWSVRSVASELHPNRNEDAVLVDVEHGMAGVFDGMGGHAHGQDASHAAASAVQHALLSWEPVTDEDDEEVFRASLANLLRAAHRRVIDLGDELYRERYVKLPEGERKKYLPPQTTGVLAMVHRYSDGRRVVAVAHTGDSRAWRVGADGSLERLTMDHDYLSNPDRRHALEELHGVELTDGSIARYRAQLDEASDESQMPDSLGKFLFRSRNVVASSLGDRTAPVRIDTAIGLLKPGDIVLLTTDGVHDNLSRSRMEELAGAVQGPDELVELLTREAAAVAATAPRSIRQGDIHVRIHRDDMTAVATLIV